MNYFLKPSDTDTVKGPPELTLTSVVKQGQDMQRTHSVYLLLFYGLLLPEKINSTQPLSV